MTWDNDFSGDQTMEYVAQTGFGITCTVNRGRLPGKVPLEFWHLQQPEVDDKSRAARFENPIVAIKKDKAWNGSVWQHTLFQSTSSCNIGHLNAINSCTLFATHKERGRGLFKRKWAIEQNKSCLLYLKTYGMIDKMDHMIKNCNLYYRQVHLLLLFILFC